MNTKATAAAFQHLALAGGNPGQALASAVSKHGEASATVRVLKAIAINTRDNVHDDALAVAYAGIVELARNKSLLARITTIYPFRYIPFNARYLVQSDGTAANFIAEGHAIQSGTLDFAGTSLPRRKAAGMLPATTEFVALLTNSSPTIAEDLAQAVATCESEAFFSNAAGDDTVPAGILYDFSPESGSNNPAADIAALIESFSGNLDAAVFLCSPKNGVKLSAAGFKDAGARGGEISGLPLVCHRSISDDRVALVEPGRILFADDGVEIDSSGQAAVFEYDSNSDAVRAVSLWQNGCVAFRVARWLNWQPAQGAVAWLDGANW